MGSAFKGSQLLDKQNLDLGSLNPCLSAAVEIQYRNL